MPYGDPRRWNKPSSKDRLCPPQRLDNSGQKIDNVAPEALFSQEEARQGVAKYTRSSRWHAKPAAPSPRTLEKACVAEKDRHPGADPSRQANHPRAGRVRGGFRYLGRSGSLHQEVRCV